MDEKYTQLTELQKSGSLEVLTQWIQADALFQGSLDPVFISIFLNQCKYDVEKTKEKMINYYTLKMQYPMLMTFGDLLEDRTIALINRGMAITDINQRDSKFPAVLIINSSRANRDLNLYDGANLLLNGSMHVLLDLPRLQRFGAIVVFDVAKLPYEIIWQLTPTYLKQTIRCLLSIWSDSIHQIHIINTGWILMAIINTGSLMLPNHLKKIVYVHSGSFECLKDFIPAENRPEEYGGTNGTIEQCNETLIGVLSKWRDVMLTNETFGFTN